MARECPNRTTFNVFQATLAWDSDDKLSQTEDETGKIKEGKNPRMGTLNFCRLSKRR